MVGLVVVSLCLKYGWFGGGLSLSLSLSLSIYIKEKERERERERDHHETNYTLDRERPPPSQPYLRHKESTSLLSWLVKHSHGVTKESNKSITRKDMRHTVASLLIC